MLIQLSAKITLNDAVQHLYHFCATLPADPFVDTRPIFTFSTPVDAINTVTARVLLPNSVDASVREAFSLSRWKTEKNARRDAAFQAYIALFNAGLVSDHLLPIRGVDEAIAEAHRAVEKIVSLVDVPGQLSPWYEVGQAWQHAENVYTSTIRIDHNGEALSEMKILLPRPLPRIASFELYWDHSVSYTTIISESYPTSLDRDYIASAGQATGLLLSSIYKSRMDISELDFIALFVARDATDLRAWTSSYHGSRQADVLLNTALASSDVGIVRDKEHNGTPHVFQGVLDSQPDASGNDEGCPMVVDGKITSNGNYFKVTKLSKRTDFLHGLPPRNQALPGLINMAASDCEIDNLPFAYSRFALFIPSIMHQVEIGFVAEHLCRTLLFPVHFTDLSLVVTAISASVARERTNYQCMEFLVSLRKMWFRCSVK